MQRIYCEHRGGTEGTENNKFYEFEDDGKRVIFRWGDIGRYDAIKGKDTGMGTKVAVVSDDASVREAIFQKKFKEKTSPKHAGGPYIVINKQTNGSSHVQKVEDRPSDVGRGWGVEVETHSNLSAKQIAENMRGRGLEVDVRTGDYFHSTGKRWDVKRDGSCGLEFASPILKGNAGIFDAKLAVEKIREVCPDAVTHKCGLHVTIGVEDHSKEDLKRLIVGYLRAQENFYSECAPWRNSGGHYEQYFRRNPTSRLAEIIATPVAEIIAAPASNIGRICELAGGYANHNDRYHGLNLTRLFSHKVIEFRMKESTCAIREVGRWIRLCVSFVDNLKRLKVAMNNTTPLTREEFNRIVGLD